MEDGAYLFGDCRFSPGDRRFDRGGISVPLPPKAFDAGHLLLRKHGSLVTRRELIETLWPDTHVTEANLTNLIGQLRRVFGHDAIETVSKYGYRFTLRVTGEPGLKQATYLRFVRGKDLLTERSLDSIREARELFLLCVATDPQFAAAWAWLGRASRLLDKFNGERSLGTSVAESAYLRALAIDPDLSCAHHFYTQLQTDIGKADEALARLLARQKRCGDDPGTLAGLVQVFRFRGLFEESIAANERAIALDPTIKTSVAHTHFANGDFPKVFETYPGNGYYLDAASWFGLGLPDRAALLLRTRLARPGLGALMRGLMASLLAILEGRNAEAIAIVETTEVLDEPEMLFYFARHCALAGAGAATVQMLQRARVMGFSSARMLESDPVFTALHHEKGFQEEVQQAKRLEDAARQLFRTGDEQ